MNYVNPEYPEVGPCRIRITADMPWLEGWRIESWASINRAMCTKGGYVNELHPSNIEVRDDIAK
jgi:hypothetical protein